VDEGARPRVRAGEEVAMIRVIDFETCLEQGSWLRNRDKRHPGRRLLATVTNLVSTGGGKARRSRRPI
jgi:hypothetical protein